MYKFVYGFLLVIVLGSSGCSDWLDVQPKTSVPEEDLFADEFGFQDALTGFYLKMGESSLYGRELTYNYMEMLAGRYEYAPDITNWTSIYNYDGTSNPQIYPVPHSTYSPYYLSPEDLRKYPSRCPRYFPCHHLLAHDQKYPSG